MIGPRPERGRVPEQPEPTRTRQAPRVRLSHHLVVRHGADYTEEVTVVLGRELPDRGDDRLVVAGHVGRGGDLHGGVQRQSRLDEVGRVGGPEVVLDVKHPDMVRAQHVPEVCGRRAGIARVGGDGPREHRIQPPILQHRGGGTRRDLRKVPHAREGGHGGRGRGSGRAQECHGQGRGEGVIPAQDVVDQQAGGALGGKVSVE
mmetsp:Transcript_51198/g.153800  ORF Transcript_51198/g.153800 Transcript_51198/m.153800 type:complete len:203 (-) Transcript_51198:644-1252(-)